MEAYGSITADQRLDYQVGEFLVAWRSLDTVAVHIIIVSLIINLFDVFIVIKDHHTAWYAGFKIRGSQVQYQVGTYFFYMIKYDFTDRAEPSPNWRTSQAIRRYLQTPKLHPVVTSDMAVTEATNLDYRHKDLWGIYQPGRLGSRRRPLIFL